MDENLSKLKDQVIKIEPLKSQAAWGPEFQLWKTRTQQLVKELFGDDGVKLFNSQGTVVFSYMDEGANTRSYLKELENRKTILQGLLDTIATSVSSTANEVDAPADILKELWRKEEALKENLIPTKEAERMHNALLAHLDQVLPEESIPGLRYRKIKAEKRITWWSSEGGYPIDNAWQKFQPFLELLAQHEAGQMIKRRIESEGLFVESRARGEDQHLLIGEKDGTGEKAHLVIDGKSGEIRIEDNRQEPTELLARIETILTLPSGKKIRTTREVIEEADG